MLLERDFYLIQNQAGADLFLVAKRENLRPIIGQKGLDILLGTTCEEFQRTCCLLTTFALAVNLLLEQRIFGLGDETLFNIGDILETAVLTHVNDTVSESGAILGKGYPSIDRRTGNFYHAFLLGLAARLGLCGVIVSNLLQTEKLTYLIDGKAVVLVSLDNLFIPQVSGRGRGIVKLRVGRHVVLLHGIEGKDNLVEFVYSDVFNPKIEDGFLPINLQVDPLVLNQYLWTNRQPQITPRKIVLWRRDNKRPFECLRDLEGFLSSARINPVFCQNLDDSFGDFLRWLRISSTKTT